MNRAILAVLFASVAQAQTNPSNPQPDATPNLYRSGSLIGANLQSWQACIDAAIADARARNNYSATYRCDPSGTSFKVLKDSAPPPPAPPPPPPPPPPAPPPPPSGTALYFSDCQAGSAAGCTPGNNANPGTQSAPKQNLAGINVNTLPAGTSLLFARGGSWTMAQVSIENQNTSASAPLTFADYGTGPLPLLRWASGIGFSLGGNFSNQTNDGGYVFRNLRIQGASGTDRGFWFVQNVRDVTIEGVHIDGWRLGMNSSTSTPYGVTNISVLNSRITNNREMGWLGHVNSGLRLEGNHFEGNNTSGSGLHHAVYNGGGDNGVFRNNRFIRNSIGADGRCSSGGLTLHGVHNNTLVEGNVFEQTAAAPGCWQVSITAGYTSSEFFRGLVVRGNTVVNGGNAGITINSAPGAVVENNRVFRTITVLNSSGTPAAQGAITVAPGGSGDNPGGGEVVRNNIACFSTLLSNDAVTRVTTTGATVDGNVMRSGSDATTGVCAR